MANQRQQHGRIAGDTGQKLHWHLSCPEICVPELTPLLSSLTLTRLLQQDHPYANETFEMLPMLLLFSLPSTHQKDQISPLLFCYLIAAVAWVAVLE